MSTNSSRKDDDQEVDLSAVTQGVKNIFGRINGFFYQCIRFVIKNAGILAVLLVIGGGLGAYLDYKKTKIYAHQIIVAPNFNSTDYLYTKVSLIQSRLEEGDTIFLKSIGFKKPKDLLEVRITPIIDIFKFVTNSGNDQNYHMVELMAQDGDIKKVVTDNMTAKNYPYHMISFVTKGKTTNEETVAPLLDYLNDNSYYKKVQAQFVKNIHDKLHQNDTIITQIDNVLKEFGQASSQADKGDKQVYINENSQLNDVIKSKQALVTDLGQQRLDLVGLDKIIKDTSVVINIRDKGSVFEKMKISLPLLLIALFLIGYFFTAFYKRQSLKYNSK